MTITSLKQSIAEAESRLKRAQNDAKRLLTEADNYDANGHPDEAEQSRAFSLRRRDDASELTGAIESYYQKLEKLERRADELAIEIETLGATRSELIG